ncbi:MAG: hypothetical protein CL570_00260 [Alphaproteobacteria bacterium]|nr:hypothetical protein [Alphaproteobacteria bacterium]HCQ71506.1 hypothetical protein [Rhodospirillaceae bacterium]|tara:strand:+ start:10560 stop:10799 length:240 start_codon:yes stop_codon:yes gene_type:complete
MKFSNIFAVLAFVAFLSAPVLADDTGRTSYGMKKQGKVHFSAKEKRTTSDMHPADIEPAAGDTMQQPKTSSDMVRLPRK